MKSMAEARAEARSSREQLENTVAELRDRLSPAQIAEDAMHLLDPELSLLGRIKSGVQNNRLLSLAVLAGVGWLVGLPRRRNGDSQKTRDADTASKRTTMKEKSNDSGQISGDEWTGSGNIGKDQAGEQEIGNQGSRTQKRRKARQGGGASTAEKRLAEPERQEVGQQL